MPGCCNNCEFKYSNETFGPAEFICVNAKAHNFRLHIFEDYPDNCFLKEAKDYDEDRK